MTDRTGKQKSGKAPKGHAPTAAELKRLRRPELLAIMLEQSMEIDRLREELESTKTALEEAQDTKHRQLEESVHDLQALVRELSRMTGR